MIIIVQIVHTYNRRTHKKRNAIEHGAFLSDSYIQALITKSSAS